MEELLAEFVVETGEKLAEADRALRRFQHAPSDQAALSEAFRAVHSVKGTCGFLGLLRLERALHSAEGKLERLRDSALPVTPGLVGHALRRLEHARLIVAEPYCLHPPEPQGGGRLPIGKIWARLPPLVRHLSGKLGKRIELTLRGENTELDREALELIRDPLTHMVRNSADHGIETPQERAAAGKPERGRIVLSARREGGYVLIEISDDGRGLATERIRGQALRRGLATEAELAAMPEAQVQRFIFEAGFSTAPAATLTSGRGMGLDVVRANVEQLRGSIGLSSRPGDGTTITISIRVLPGARIVARTASASVRQCSPPRAVIGQTHSTRPPRTPTYQS